MKLKRFDRETVLVWATAILWVPAMLVGILVAITVTGYRKGYQKILSKDE